MARNPFERFDQGCLSSMCYSSGFPVKREHQLLDKHIEAVEVVEFPTNCEPPC